MRFSLAIGTTLALAIASINSVQASPMGASASFSGGMPVANAGISAKASVSINGFPDANCGTVHWDDNGQWPCGYDSHGHLRQVKIHGCPVKTQPPQGTSGNYGCSTQGGSNSLISLNVLNCANICILSAGKCPTPQNCQTKGGNGNIIGVTAAECSPVNLLDGPK